MPNSLNVPTLAKFPVISSKNGVRNNSQDLASAQSCFMQMCTLPVLEESLLAFAIFITPSFLPAEVGSGFLGGYPRICLITRQAEISFSFNYYVLLYLWS